VHVAAALGDDSSRSSVEGHPRHDLSEELIHQMIETIEFVLGSVSNTASYLRLWALSLAHAQLAKVFFTMCVAGPWASGNPILIVIGVAVFILVTLGVLMMMDVLEWFLHALRLHWVEFQNKFFKGQGILFVPFSFGPEKLAN
jgi:V-type H+-transporting ATPase subunit a